MGPTADIKEPKRLKLLEQLQLLELNESVLTLAKTLVEEGPLPKKAAEDALHIAVATVHGVDYLLTWNCKLTVRVNENQFLGLARAT